MAGRPMGEECENCVGEKCVCGVAGGRVGQRPRKARGDEWRRTTLRVQQLLMVTCCCLRMPVRVNNNNARPRVWVPRMEFFA